MPVSAQSERKLSNRQIDCLKVLKRAPKTTRKAHEQLVKKNKYIYKHAIGACMRTLEDRELVRAREQFDRKLKRNIILWELTDKGRDTLAKI